MPPKWIHEHNTIVKDIRQVDVLFGYCYPSTYRAGMTGLATHLFYSILNLRDDTSCERYFRFDTPSPVHSIESNRELKRNHIVGFSLTYEEDIINLVQMLSLGKIPVRAEDRKEKDPVVLMGGPVVSANPEPYVDFVDAFVIGEGDIVIEDIIDVTREAESRLDTISGLAQLEGLYVPSIEPSVVDRLTIHDVDTLRHPIAQIVPDVPEGTKLEPVFGKSLLVEVARGCGHSCKFCLVGHVCQPRRVRSLNRLKEIVIAGLEKTPVRKVSLIASSLGDMDRLEELASWIVNKDVNLSVPSLRADSVTEKLLSCLVKGGQRTLTIAPETGSEELRRSIGKGLVDSKIHDAVTLAKKVGYRSIKLYYIIGLPGETKDDVQSIVEMTKQIARDTRLRIIASVNPFIPKAHTRWQREPQPKIEILREKIKLVQKGFRNVPRTQLESLDPRRARIQAALSLGDRSLGKLIELSASYGGFSGWRRAEKETGISLFSIANDAERLQGSLPWSFIRI